MSESQSVAKILSPITKTIFFSRWLQAPLYMGLIITQAVYVFKFIVELWHLISTFLTLDENQLMLIVLGLIDVVMVSNLLIMIIVGGYDIFVSRLKLDGHPDMPEWLDHINANTMKIKLSTALVGISSIHLLRTFFNLERMENETVMLQVIIHVVFLLSSIALAYTANLTIKPTSVHERY